MSEEKKAVPVAKVEKPPKVEKPKEVVVKGEQKPRRGVVKAAHHAKRLLPLARINDAIARDGVRGILYTERGMHVTTRTKGTFVIAPFKGYEGIDIKLAGKLLVRLKVVYPKTK